LELQENKIMKIAYVIFRCQIGKRFGIAIADGVATALGEYIGPIVTEFMPESATVPPAQV
jgi:hypothetical protein